MKQIRKGAFLIVQAGDSINVMTIGWASFGFLWGKPMVSIMVVKHASPSVSSRKRRIHHLGAAKRYERRASILRSKSGRNMDKFKACRLEIFPGEKVKTPIIKVPGLHFECAIVYKSAVDPKHLVESYTHLYPAKDYHTIYYGEIRYSYVTLDGE